MDLKFKYFNFQAMTLPHTAYLTWCTCSVCSQCGCPGGRWMKEVKLRVSNGRNRPRSDREWR